MKAHSTHIMRNYTHAFHNVIPCLFIIQLITASQTFGQGKFVEGYILTNQSDTIRGFVRDENWATSPDRIAFRNLNGEVSAYAAESIAGFGLVTAKEIYKSRKIGVLNINLMQPYMLAPSLETRDSVQVFLQEVVSGGVVTLFEFLDHTQHSRFFIEKEHRLKELFYYPFYKSVDNRNYLVVYDEYKKQLVKLCADAERFREPLPPYQEKHLKEYIKSYNAFFTKDSVRYLAENHRLAFNLELIGGVENWGEEMVIHNKATYGFGLRTDFPRKFRNRYVKASMLFTPGLPLGFSPGAFSKKTLRTLEVGLGRYFGSGGLRPFLGLNASIVNRGYRSDFLGMNVGISYKRLISVEVGHFANFYCFMTKTSFLIQPRISLHYFANLNFGQNRMR
ncbi:hypothetical protein CLV60_11150 [Dyadobacter jiangsuensis]|uniref:Uncharacterized protein n=1 Tax=Dyadobacter jiangsuensis TaxID=1591085 RepID=A0A2P8FV51_9BACT|nr:hypothetical protein CLV60_11150 [Dyadobacter jiangsuensis]